MAINWRLGGAVVSIALIGCGGLEQPPNNTGPEITPTETVLPPRVARYPKLVEPGTLAALPLQPATPPPETVRTPQMVSLCGDGIFEVAAHRDITRRFADVFTVEFWVKLDTIADQRLLRSTGMRVRVGDRQIRVDVGGRTLNGHRLFDNEWTHVAVVGVEQEMTLFINGQLADRRNKRQDDGGVSGPFTFGPNGDACQLVDNVRLTAAPLYTGSFLLPEEKKIPTGTAVAEYDFDGVMSREIPDLSGNGFLATRRGDSELLPGHI